MRRGVGSSSGGVRGKRFGRKGSGLCRSKEQVFLEIAVCIHCKLVGGGNLDTVSSCG